MLKNSIKAYLRDSALPFYGVMLVAITVIIASFWSTLLDQDEMIYALVAGELLEGKLPYQGIFDHKPIGTYYIYALFFSLFGESYGAIRIMSSSMLIGTTLIIYLSLRNLQFSQHSKIAAATFCLAFPIGIDGLSGNTEGIQTFLLSLLFLLSTHIAKKNNHYKILYLFTFGSTVALGFSVNYLFSLLALAAFLSLALYLSLTRIKIKNLLFYSIVTFIGFVAGNILIFSPYIIDLFFGGNLLSDYFNDQQQFLSGYGPKSIDKRIIIDKFFFWIMPFIPIVIGGAFAFIYLNKKKWLPALFSIATFLAACIAASASLFFFNHYWILASVPLALFAALSVDSIKDIQANRIFCYGLAFVLLFYMLSGTGRIVNHLLNTGGERELKAANEFIQRNINQNDLVVSISVSPVYIFLNNLNTNQKYHFQGHVEQLNDSNILDGDQYFVDLLNSNPDFIIVNPAFCKAPLIIRFVNTCQHIEEKLTLLATFEGIRPVSIFQEANQN